MLSLKGLEYLWSKYKMSYWISICFFTVRVGRISTMQWISHLMSFLSSSAMIVTQVLESSLFPSTTIDEYYSRNKCRICDFHELFERFENGFRRTKANCFPITTANRNRQTELSRGGINWLHDRFCGPRGILDDEKHDHCWDDRENARDTLRRKCSKLNQIRWKARRSFSVQREFDVRHVS